MFEHYSTLTIQCELVMCFFYSKYSYLNLCSKIRRESEDMRIWLFIYFLFYNHSCIDETKYVFVYNEVNNSFSNLERSYLLSRLLNNSVCYCPMFIISYSSGIDICVTSQGVLFIYSYFRHNECWRKCAYICTCA